MIALPPKARERMSEPAEPHPEYNILFRKLRSISPLAEDEKQCLGTLPFSIRSVAADQDILREGDRPSECCLVVEGFVCRYKLTQEGKRQIFSFHLPGDIPDLQSLHINVMDHSLLTLTPSKLGFIPHESMIRLMRQCPRVADVLWRDTLIDAAVFREWMMGMGRRSAETRIAHLLCEVLVRMRAVGLSNGDVCELPITQAELGDALGLSTVHVNRSLQELRGKRLITLRGSILTIQDWEGLKAAGEFDPTYLHLDGDTLSAA
jgi:CRP-like cAMP-binding protein